MSQTEAYLQGLLPFPITEQFTQNGLIYVYIPTMQDYQIIQELGYATSGDPNNPGSPNLYVTFPASLLGQAATVTGTPSSSPSPAQSAPSSSPPPTYTPPPTSSAGSASDVYVGSVGGITLDAYVETGWNSQTNGHNTDQSWNYLADVIYSKIPAAVASLDTISATSI